MAPSISYTFYTPESSFRAFATLIAAEYNGISVDVSTDTSEATLAKSPTGKLPILEVTKGSSTKNVIFSAHSTARYIASIRGDTGLVGTSIDEAAAIDGWMDFALQELELPACIWFYPVAGYMQFNEEAYQKAKIDLANGLTKLNDHLSSTKKKYLVGDDQITLADIIVVCTLLYPMKLVCDPEYLKPFPEVVRWFQSCVKKPEFVQIVGQVEMAEKEATVQ